MKPTQFKDALRNIGKQIVSFLSVIVIAMLGVTTYLGIDYSDEALRQNGSIMYNAVNYRDVEILSPLLLSGEDLEDILSTEGVTDAERVWQTSAKVSTGEMRQDVSVISLTERINLPLMVEGRLPQTAGECAVEERLFRDMGWQIGDTIQTLNAKGETAESLKESGFVITGVANHPDHVSTSIPDTLYVMVRPEAFDTDALNDCFMKAEIVVDKPAGVDRFKARYDAAVAPVLERLQGVAESCTQRRREEIDRQRQTMLDEGQEQLDEAKEALEDAREQLDKGWAELDEGEQKLADAEKQLEEAQDKLDSGENELWAARMALDSGLILLQEKRAELDQAKQMLEEGEQLLNTRLADLLHLQEEIDREIDEAMALVEQVNQELAQAEQDYLASVTEAERSEAEEAVHWLEEKRTQAVETLEDAQRRGKEIYDQTEETRALLKDLEENYPEYVRRYEEGEAAYAEGQKQYDEAKAKYDAALWQWYVARNQIWESEEELASGKAEAESGREKLEDGEEEYADKLAEYEEASLKLEDARNSLSYLEAGSWILFDCRGNSSYVQLQLGSSNLDSLKMTFSMLFVLVGALVIYATISKMIDEQRNLVGVGKALGLYNREIFVKYLLFGVSGTLVGTILGILLARFAMEVYVLRNASPYYTFDTTRPTVIPESTAIALAAGLLLSVAAVWFACTKLMRATAIQLMQPRVPAGRKKAGKSSGHVLSLYSRLILLNIRSDLRRVIVTVVSVAGCCALVVIGFTMKSGVEGALRNQFEKIVVYDGRVKFDTQTSQDAADEIRRKLDEEGIDYTELYDGVVSFRIKENLVGELLCGDLSQIGNYYRILDWKTGEPLEPTDEGIFVQKRTAESYDLQIGSELELSLGGTQTVKARVAGIFDNYIGRVMMMSTGYYRTLTGKDCPTNTFFVYLNGTDPETLSGELRQIKGFESYSRSDTDRQVMAASSSLVTAVVALFIFMAAVMAGVVLTNLINIYILQKKPELIIMRINGFTVREVIGYVVRESVVTTVVGILIGIAMGAGIAYKIICATESVFIQYDRSVSLPAWLFGAAITAMFAVLINALVLRQVRTLKLTDMN